MQSQLPHIEHTLKRSIWNVLVTFLTCKVTNQPLVLIWVSEPDTMCGSALYLLQSIQNYLSVSRTEKIEVKWHKGRQHYFLEHYECSKNHSRILWASFSWIVTLTFCTILQSRRDKLLPGHDINNSLTI